MYGAIHERQPYQDITENDCPRPNTAYGRSKLEAERYLDSIGNDFPYIILRPTGVYGPREKDYFLMAESVKRHIDFGAGFRRQDITFVYVLDVVQAVFLALDRGMSGRKYFLTDGEVYQSADFSRLLKKEMGVKWMLRIVAPIWVLRAVTYIGERIGRITHKPTALNTTSTTFCDSATGVATSNRRWTNWAIIRTTNWRTACVWRWNGISRTDGCKNETTT